ncbi:MAG: SET domain-containing protein [Bacteroidota bacterium]|jgi:SET domain-containing protein
MVQPYLIVLPTEKRGRGVFATDDIPAGTTIEISPVIVMESVDRSYLDQTKLHDYIFEWNPASKQCCMGLGYISIYNHAYHSNCEYEMDFENDLMEITTVRDIQKGEELFINYNGSFDDAKPVWFEVQ